MKHFLKEVDNNLQEYLFDMQYMWSLVNHHCHSCKKRIKESELTRKNTNLCGDLVLEYSLRCPCGTEVDSWSFGNTSREYEVFNYSSKYPKTFAIMKDFRDFKNKFRKLR